MDKIMEAAYGISFSKKKEDEDVIKYMIEQFQKNGLILEKENQEKIYSIKTNRENMDKMAEILGILKEDQSGKFEPFTRCNALIKFKHYHTENFYLPCEEMYLLNEIMYRTQTTNIFNEFFQKNPSHHHISPGDQLIPCAQRLNIVHELIPLHTQERRQIWKKLLWSFPLSEDTIHTIRSYYGAKVAFYFAWMRYFTIWLTIPGCFGGIIYFRNTMDSSISIDNSLLAPIFTLFMIIWAAFFLRFWQRQSASISCLWGTNDFEEIERIRPEFYGEIRSSIVTGLNERYYPYRYRVGHYIISTFVTLFMLILAASVMILSLNFQGYIHSNSFGSSYLHFPFLHQFSLPGAIFDQAGGGPYPMILPFIPTIVHSLVILQLNTIYRTIAWNLTQRENHPTQYSFENALILKRFLFEAFDCYIALFYLAFLEMDIILLRNELISLYTVDSIRRIVTESLLPLLVHCLTKEKIEEETNLYKKTDDPLTLKKITKLLNSSRIEEFHMDEYEQFDDYMEMVIEFGYIMLFASAFPLAALLSILSNIIEAKSDLFKLSFVCQRPQILPVNTIGIWFSVLKVLLWMSAITNVFIFGFTTEQMLQVFPSWFQIEASMDVEYGGNDHTHSATLGMGRWVVGMVFFIEHILIFLIQIIFTMIPKIPEKIKKEIERRQLKRTLQLENCTLQAHKTFQKESNEKEKN